MVIVFIASAFFISDYETSWLVISSVTHGYWIMVEHKVYRCVYGDGILLLSFYISIPSLFKSRQHC